MSFHVKQCVAVFLCLMAGLMGIYMFAENNNSLAVSSQQKTKYIALTFDDGPKAGTTDKLLDGLRSRGVHATFFLIGCQIEGNEAILEKMVNDGHLIGNHTFGHVDLSLLCSEDMERELEDCFDAIEEASETSDDSGASDASSSDFRLIRPPYGNISDALKKNADGPLILWSVDTRDWTGKSAQSIADYIVKNAKEGDIILLHDIYEQSVEGALMAVDTMQKNGYTFVTVKELFEKNGIPLEAGKIYRKTYN